MGCCLKPVQVAPQTFSSKIHTIIENDDAHSLELLSISEEFKSEYPEINNAYFQVKDYRLNLLALAVWCGAPDCFRFIHQTMKASHECMEKLLKEYKISGMDIICQRGNTELLDYYLPFFCESSESLPMTEEVSVSLDFSQSKNNNPRPIPSSYTPIQRACEIGHLSIISHIYKYFLDKPTTPHELDIDYQDDTSGENCALIACKTGNYSMIRFLHSNCHGNFFLKNKLGETGVQILAASNKKKPVKEFHESMVYLINVVGVNFTHNHEEIMLLIDNEKTVQFFEKKLREKGIDIDKRELEEENKMVKLEQVRSIEEVRLDPYYGKDFNFRELYEDVMKDPGNEDISVISGESRDTTPFTSVLNELPTGEFN